MGLGGPATSPRSRSGPTTDLHPESPPEGRSLAQGPSRRRLQRCRRQRLQRCHPRPAPVGKREGRFARPSRTSWRRPQSLDPLLPQCRIPLRPAIPGRRTPRRWRPFRRWVSVPHGSKVQWRTVPDGDPPVARWRAGSGPARRRISQPTHDIERVGLSHANGPSCDPTTPDQPDKRGGAGRRASLRFGPSADHQ